MKELKFITEVQGFTQRADPLRRAITSQRRGDKMRKKNTGRNIQN